MSTSNVERKLTAILVTDVVGYSRLMGDDPEGTLATLTEYREVFSGKILEYKGRVINAPGDSLLADFTSVLDAVSCAVDIQRELAERNQELPDTRRMDFRIGVNLGDVLVQDGDIYGDGVNVAARLESLAEPGGICISGQAHREVKNRLPLHFEYLGEQQVKNISEAVETYRILSQPGAAAHRVVRAKKGASKSFLKGMAALAVAIVMIGGGWLTWDYVNRPSGDGAGKAGVPGLLSETPSIAVMAFDNMSGDPKQEYFSDGISESLITQLSKVPRLVVISRKSSFSYKGKAIKIRQVGKELGVRYVLEGSVQKAGGRIRINVQLIEAEKEKHIWAEKYDRDFKNLFEVQDEIINKILTEVAVKLVSGEGRRPGFTPPANMEAFDLFLRANALFSASEGRDQKSMETRKLLEQAIALDPEYVQAYAWLAIGYAWPNIIGRARPEELEKAVAHAKRALALDPATPRALIALGVVAMARKQNDKALGFLDQARKIAPSDSNIYFIRSLIESYTGQHDLAVVTFKGATRLEPYFNRGWLYFLALYYMFSGHFDDALNTHRELEKKAPNRVVGINLLGSLIYAAIGDLERANAYRKKLTVMIPNISVSLMRKVSRRTPADIERISGWMRKAGYPE